MEGAKNLGLNGDAMVDGERNSEGFFASFRQISDDNDDKELHGGDRVTQGLSTVWSLMLLRPPIRDACLRIALKSAVHHLEEVRMKAIRLVANKLYPLPSISKDIEDFAKDMLLLVASDNETSKKEADGTHAELQKLPTAQLENALNRTPGLKAPLIAHASEPLIRSSLPRSTLVVLGLVSEPPPPPKTSTQPQPTQSQNEAGGDSENEAVTTTDKSKESPSPAS
ncbi:hypothetical protein CASFOL_037827 [Castilleja foliolosa]|uniref:Symplekin/Pta1 N-terminal domain-containing protein n=1 Tax=Castilleja foliolosa TaxID=1961234 RepID=A0ABD3BK61_9LAMI